VDYASPTVTGDLLGRDDYEVPLLLSRLEVREQWFLPFTHQFFTLAGAYDFLVFFVPLALLKHLFPTGLAHLLHLPLAVLHFVVVEVLVDR